MFHIKELLIPENLIIFCIAGTSFIVTGSIIAAWFYRGKNGERYSMLNHFISELGERGVSRAAPAFNLGLILGGLALLPAAIILGIALPGTWSKLGMAAGVVAAISMSMVGVFPMDNMNPHIKAAVTYFRSGLFMVLFFTLAIAFQSGETLIPRLFSLAGVPAIFAYSYFLMFSRVTTHTEANPLSPLEEQRPRVWKMAVYEWMIFITTVPWLLAISFGM